MTAIGDSFAALWQQQRPAKRDSRTWNLEPLAGRAKKPRTSVNGSDSDSEDDVFTLLSEKYELSEKYDRPGNCEKLAFPKVNPKIWGKLNHYAKKQDLKLSARQNMLVKVGAVIVQSAQNLMDFRTKGAANSILLPRLQVRLMLSRCWDIQIMSSRSVDERRSSPT